MMDDVGSDAGLPSGTVTFLLTDVEGSTRLWERDALVAAVVVARHRDLIGEAVDAHAGGRPLEQGEGDNVVAVFARATDAVRAAAAAQRALGAEPWPEGGEIRVRMAVHTGEAAVRDDGTYAGAVLNRCARLRSLAHGGQVLISSASADLVAEHLEDGATLVDLGVHRLRDLSRPERVWELHGAGLEAGHPPLRSLDALPNNLPVQLSSFIGREDDIAQGVRLLGEARLLTFTGAGGCGKTRLAQRVAGEVADRYPGGAWWVELAPLGEGALVADAVAGAIGLRVPGEGAAFDVIAEHLQGFPGLIVLDNCEHLVAGVATFADRLLRTCADATVLATSREPLAVEGEVTWRVPSLAVPPAAAPGDELPPAALAQFDAVRLFIDRAVQVRSNFRVDNANAPAVAQICARLDGIPLAIELAAARIRSLPPERIATELDDRFRLLSGGNRSALPRQQTLQASVDWSHELLDPPERALLRRLSAFAGGFELDAAETVAAGPPVERYDVLDVLDRLVDKSLVQPDEGGGGVRYRLLETIRQYGLARLEDAGEAAAAKDRHLQWVRTLVGDHLAGVTWARPADLDALDAEHPNIRAALDWALLNRPDDALDLVGSLGMFWAGRGHYVDAATVLPVTLALEPSDPALLARARWARAYVRFYAGDVLGALEDAGLGLDGALAAGDPGTAGRCRHTLGTGFLLADPQTALSHFVQAVALAREAGDAWCEADAMQMVAFTHLVTGSFADALDAMEQSIAVARRHGGAFQEGWHHHGLGTVALYRGDIAAAETAFATGAAIGREIGDPAVESYGPLAWALGLVELGHMEAAEALVRPFATSRKDWGGLGTAQLATLTAALGPDGLTGGGGGLAAAGHDLVAQTLVAEGAIALALSAVAALDAGALEDAAERASATLEHRQFFQSVQHGYLVQASVERERGGERAEDLAHEALTAAAGQHALLLPRALALVAGLAVDAGAGVEGARLLAAADRLGSALGRRRSPAEQAGFEADVAAAQDLLGADTFDAAWAEGAALSADEAIAFARRARGERGRPSHGWASLTPTEEQVVQLVSDGLSNPQVAERLLMGRETVKTHLTHVFQKLGVGNRTELATKVAERRQAAGWARTL